MTTLIQHPHLTVEDCEDLAACHYTISVGLDELITTLKEKGITPDPDHTRLMSEYHLSASLWIDLSKDKGRPKA